MTLNKYQSIYLSAREFSYSKGFNMFNIGVKGTRKRRQQPLEKAFSGLMI